MVQVKDNTKRGPGRRRRWCRRTSPSRRCGEGRSERSCLGQERTLSRLKLPDLPSLLSNLPPVCNPSPASVQSRSRPHCVLAQIHLRGKPRSSVTRPLAFRAGSTVRLPEFKPRPGPIPTNKAPDMDDWQPATGNSSPD